MSGIYPPPSAPPPSYDDTYPPRGGVAPPPSQSGAAGGHGVPSGATAGPNAGPPEDEVLVREAIETKIPAWTARLQAVLKAPAVIDLDFNRLVDGYSSGPERLRVVAPAVRGVAKLGGLLPEPSAVEQFVRACEACLTDPAVVRDVLSRMPALRVTFVNARGGAADAKGLAFADDGSLVYTGVFAQGAKGVLSQCEVEAFFEKLFFARERDLVTRFAAAAGPEAVTRLRAVTGRPDFALDFDPPRLLAAVTQPEKRLETARLLISQIGLTRKLDAAGKMAELGLNKAAAAVERGVTGENEQFKDTAAPIEREVYTSPNVLQPVLRAVEAQCKVADVARQFAAAVRGLVFEPLPSKSPTTLVLREHPTSGADLLPQADGRVPFRDCWLVYAAPWEDGKKAVLKEREALEALEAYFRGCEKALVFGFLGDDLPRARSAVQQHAGQHVEVEVLWSTFFHAGVKPGAGRLEVAENVCGRGSALLLTPMVLALDAVVRAGVGVDVRGMLAARVCKVTIQAHAGKQAKPALAWGAHAPPPADAGYPPPPTPAALVYTCAIDRGHRGFFADNEFRAALRHLLGLPTPPEESGAAALLGKATTELSRLSTDATKMFSKLAFGGKKKK